MPREGFRLLAGRRPGDRPQYHSFIGSKAVWDVLPDDGLPRYDGANPDADHRRD